MRILKKISRQAVILSAVLVMIAAIFVSNKTVANAAGAVVKNLNSVNVNFDITGFKEGNALPSGDSFNVQVTGFTSGQEEAKFFIQDSILYIKGTQAHVDKGYITQSDLNEANNGWVEAWAYSDEYRISADDKYQVYYWFVIEDGYAFDKSNADKVKVSPSTVKLERIETGDTDYGAWVSYYADMYFTFGAAGNTPEDQPVEKPSHTHSYGSYKTTTKATFGKDGLQTAACNGCNSKKTKVIPAVKTPTLSTASYTFNNKVKTPSVTVKTAKVKN